MQYSVQLMLTLKISTFDIPILDSKSLLKVKIFLISAISEEKM